MPTFGADPNVAGTAFTNAGDPAIYLRRVTTPADVGIVTKLTAEVSGYENGDLGRAVVYSDNAGKPQNLLYVGTTDTPLPRSVRGKYDLPTDFNPAPNTPIWIGIMTSTPTNVYYIAGTGNIFFYDTHLNPTYPDALPVEEYADEAFRYGTQAMSIYATYTPAGPQPPTANFSYSKNLLTVNVVDASIAGSGAIVGYDWDWGDGTAHGSGATASHTYANSGSYGITLTVTDTNGLSDYYTEVVTVSNATPPTANFVATPTYLVVSFDASSSYAGTYPITGYEWDFGDGTAIGTGKVTSHTYATAGTYNVTLTVIDSGGNSDTVTSPVTVTSPPVDIIGTTPWDSAISYPTLEEGTYEISVPPTVTEGGKIYEFLQWEDGSNNPVRTFTVSGDTLIRATYVESSYTLTIVPSTGGTTSPSGTQTYTAGSIAVVTANPTVGYNFTNWLLDGNNAGVSNPIHVSMNADHTLTPVFTYNPVYYSLTIVPPADGGTTSPSGTQTLLQGTVIQVTATPYSTFFFSHWLLDGADVGSANPISVNMNANHTLQAVFAPITYTLTTTSTTGGTTSPSGTQTYNAGVDVDVTATPTGNYLFDHWVLDGSDAGTTNPITVTMNANHTLQAVFVAGPVTITLNAVAGLGGTVSPSGALVLTVGQSYQFTASEGVGYDFDHWDLSGENKGSTPSIILNVTGAMNGQILTALFTTEPPPKVTITLAIAGNGTTDIAPGTQILNVGDTITITAIPQSGATFVGWQLDSELYSSDNPLQLTVTADMNGKTLTANFATPTQAGFPLWALIVVIPVTLIGGYVLRRNGKKPRR